MLKIDRSTDGTGVRLVLSGRIGRDGLAELRRALDDETLPTDALTIDAQELRILDRDAVRFLVSCVASGIRLVNTPAYVREWMRREQNGVADDAHDSTSPK